MTDDILHQIRKWCNDLSITFSTMIVIEDHCVVIANLPVSHFGIRSPNRRASDIMNTETNRELQYNTAEIAAFVTSNIPLLTHEQKTTTSLCCNFRRNQVDSFFFMHRVKLAKKFSFR